MKLTINGVAGKFDDKNGVGLARPFRSVIL